MHVFCKFLKFTEFFRNNYCSHWSVFYNIWKLIKTVQYSPNLLGLNQLGDFTCVFWDCSNVFSIQVSLDAVCVSVCWCREVTCSFSLSCKQLTSSPNEVVSDLPFSNIPAKIKTMIYMVFYFHPNKINHTFFLKYLIN